MYRILVAFAIYIDSKITEIMSSNKNDRELAECSTCPYQTMRM